MKPIDLANALLKLPPEQAIKVILYVIDKKNDLDFDLLFLKRVSQEYNEILPKALVTNESIKRGLEREVIQLLDNIQNL